MAYETCHSYLLYGFLHRTRWGAIINPMSYYLNGVFVNEFDGNSDASGDVNYSDLKNLYDFHFSRGQCFWIVVFIGVLYRLFWLILLAIWDTSIQQEGNYQSRVSQVRRKARKLVTAGLRWRGASQPYSSHIQSSEVTNAMMEEDAFAELEANIGKAYLLGDPSASSPIHRDQRLSQDPAFNANPGPGMSLAEQLSRAAASLPNEYIPLNSGPEAENCSRNAILPPLGRSANSVSASSGHIDL
jgi:hypothetical protein